MNERQTMNSYDPSRLTSYDPSQAAAQNTQQANSYDPNAYNTQQTGGYDPNAYNAQQTGGYDPNAYNAQQTGGYNPNAYNAQQTGGYNPNAYNAQQTGGYDPNAYNTQQTGGYDPNAYNTQQTGGYNPNAYNTQQTNSYAANTYDQPQTSGFNTAQGGGFGYENSGAVFAQPQSGFAGNKQGGMGAKGGLALLVFLGGIIGMVIASQVAPVLCISVFGAMFAIFGFMAFRSNEKKYPEDKMTALTFTLFGLAFFAAPLILRHISNSDKYTAEQAKQYTGMAIGLISMVIGAAVVVLPLISDKMKRNRCTASVEAVCAEVLSKIASGRRGHRHHHRVYAPVWEYFYDGRTIRQAESTYSNINVPQVGSTTELKINPDDPEDIYRKNGAAKVFVAIVGAIFVGVGLLVALTTSGVIG